MLVEDDPHVLSAYCTFVMILEVRQGIGPSRLRRLDHWFLLHIGTLVPSNESKLLVSVKNMISPMTGAVCCNLNISRSHHCINMELNTFSNHHSKNSAESDNIAPCVKK